MPFFQKKPVWVEARHFTPETASKVAEWCNGRLASKLSMPPIDYMEIYTLEGVMTAQMGDWIIEGVKGEFYPCREDIFNETYELVQDEVSNDEDVGC